MNNHRWGIEVDGEPQDPQGYELYTRINEATALLLNGYEITHPWRVFYKGNLIACRPAEDYGRVTIEDVAAKVAETVGL